MLILGLDTGGTYTDSVLLDPKTRRIVAKSKVFTDKTNLSSCIGACVRALPQNLLTEVSLFCISTTLATNAVVKGDSGRVGLLLMGRKPDGKLPVSFYRQINGLLDIKGKELQPVDEAEVRTVVAEAVGQVDSLAISGFASVRNPAHEIAVWDIVRDMTNLPVVCGHELSTSLGHHDRAVTAVINAGLIPKIELLTAAVQETARELRITAPIMIVRGDGSLIRDDTAAARPIETILSGPAASIAGGLYLSGVEDALLLDMGGTTTDIALSRGGKVSVSERGAWVGGWRTMVRAAAVATFGLGGDSRISLGVTPGELVIGPRRVQPLCVASRENPEVGKCLQRYANCNVTELSIATHGTFYRLSREPENTASKIERNVADILRDGSLNPAEMAERLFVGVAQIPAEEMCRRGILTAISLTPTDILHALGIVSIWDAEASRFGAELFAGKMGLELNDFLEKTHKVITGKLASASIESAMRLSGGSDAHAPTLGALVEGVLLDDNDILETSFTLKKTIVAVGAPVAAWLPAAAQFLNTELLVPNHAEVANAVGAAVGQIRVAFDALVRPDRESMTYTAYAPEGRRDFAQRQEAEKWVLDTIRQLAEKRIEEWGGDNAVLSERITPHHVIDSDGNPLYIETKITVEAIGNPSAIQNDTGE